MAMGPQWGGTDCLGDGSDGDRCLLLLVMIRASVFMPFTRRLLPNRFCWSLFALSRFGAASYYYKSSTSTSGTDAAYYYQYQYCCFYQY